MPVQDRSKVWLREALSELKRHLVEMEHEKKMKICLNWLWPKWERIEHNSANTNWTKSLCFPSSPLKVVRWAYVHHTYLLLHVPSQRGNSYHCNGCQRDFLSRKHTYYFFDWASLFLTLTLYFAHLTLIYYPKISYRNKIRNLKNEVNFVKGQPNACLWLDICDGIWRAQENCLQLWAWGNEVCISAFLLIWVVENWYN